jgi:hypothetical protein
MTIIIDYPIVAPVVPVSGMTYGRLKSAIANRLGRTNLTGIIPDFITLAESRIYRGFRDIDVSVAPMRIQQMIAVETDTLATLPIGYLEMSRLTVPTCPKALTYVTPEVFASLCPAPYPRYYTLQDGGIAIEGGEPTAFSFSYYKRFPALVEESDTNWLLDNHPSIYLYSALIEAYAHLKDDARIPMATRMYAAAVSGLIDADMTARYSGSSLAIGSAR